MKIISYLLVCLSTFAMLGCANPLNKVTYQKYYAWGVAAEQHEDYKIAKENYWRALVNARIGNLESSYHAASSYSLARMVGILCDHKNAEILLLDAIKFDKESNGPVYMSYLELARLKFDQQKYDEAVPYFQKSLAIVDNQDFFNADPVGFAVIFEEYSQALNKTGNMTMAAAYSKRAKDIRTQYPNKDPIAERTPYTKNCK